MTIKQKQALLSYLGYYVGAIDGIWGSGSKASANAFKDDYGVTADEKNLLAAVNGTLKPTEKPQSGDFWDGIKYFKREEFRCKCGGRYCNGYPAEMKEKVVKIADGARANFNAPGRVISGLRCTIHNANEGGVANSRHMTGKAIDLRIDGVSADALLAYVQKQPGVRYAYKINSTNVHFDIE